MPYHPSRLVTLPFHYIETSSSLGGKELGRLERGPPFPTRLNGARRRVKSEVFDLFCESGADKVLLDESAVFDDALSLHFKEVQLLDKVRIVLVELSISVDISKESPVIEVVDGILENGISGSVTPEAMTEPGREQLQWLVRGVIGRGI